MYMARAAHRHGTDEVRDPDLSRPLPRPPSGDLHVAILALLVIGLQERIVIVEELLAERPAQQLSDIRAGAQGLTGLHCMLPDGLPATAASTA